jgi:hypothetical protein
MPIVGGVLDGTTVTLGEVLEITTPPTDCFDPTFTVSPQGYDVATSHTVPPKEYLLSRGVDPACYPSKFQPGLVYSPSVCPESHTGALTNINTHGGITVTTISCCPE